MLEWIDFGVAAGVAKKGNTRPTVLNLMYRDQKATHRERIVHGLTLSNGFTYYKRDSSLLLISECCGVRWDMQKICVSAWTPQSRDDCMTKKGFRAASWCKGVVKFLYLTQRRGGTAPVVGRAVGMARWSVIMKIMCVSELISYRLDHVVMRRL